MKTNALLLISIIVFSCNSSDRIVYKSLDSSGHRWIVKKIYDKKGRLSVEELLNADSIKAGYFKKWNGNQLVSTGYYLRGKKDSTWIYMDISGDTIKVENWFDGRRFRQQLDFFDSGKDSRKTRLHNYSFFNLDGEEIFYARFNPDGKVDHLNGFPIFSLYNKSDLESGSIFELTSFVGIPDPLKYIFTVKEINKKSNNVISIRRFSSDSVNQLSDTGFGKEFYIENRYSNSGNYVWRMILELIDIKGKILVNDSTDIEIIVHK